MTVCVPVAVTGDVPFESQVDKCRRFYNKFIGFNGVLSKGCFGNEDEENEDKVFGHLWKIKQILNAFANYTKRRTACGGIQLTMRNTSLYL